MRVVGTHLSCCSIVSPYNDVDEDEEIFEIDESADTSDSTLENIRLALLDGLMKSVLSDVSDLKSSSLMAKFPVSGASSSEMDIMCHVER
jgi:hypothetical protein